MNTEIKMKKSSIRCQYITKGNQFYIIKVASCTMNANVLGNSEVHIKEIAHTIQQYGKY